MRLIHICIFLILISISAVAQTEAQKEYIKSILTSNKIEITDQDIGKILSDPAHWIILASYYNNDVHIFNNYTSYKFILGGVFLRAKASVYRASDIPAWLWNYDSDSLELKIITESNTFVYKVLILNPVEMLLEDIEGDRLYLSAKTDYQSAPRPLLWRVRFTTIPTAISLKEAWKIK